MDVVLALLDRALSLESHIACGADRTVKSCLFFIVTVRCGFHLYELPFTRRVVAVEQHVFVAQIF
jgi:hypothetical protein